MRPFKAFAVSAIVLASTSAQANNWDPLQTIDLTTDTFESEMVVTTGFLHEMDVIGFDQPILSAAPQRISTEDIQPEQSGWAGMVEVEMDREPTLPFDKISTFSDTFATSERETKMRGFYTMRYQFDTRMPFRPYAGAGLGLVATRNDVQATGIVAGRATAGFDLTVGKDAAVFAEYAFVKSGGVSLGMAGSDPISTGALPDTEHSLKLGFRRTF